MRPLLFGEWLLIAGAGLLCALMACGLFYAPVH